MSWQDLGIRLQTSAATLSNWKRRGVSKEGALMAEREFGCSAHYVLTGEGDAVQAGSAADPGHTHTPAAAEPVAHYLAPAQVLTLLEAIVNRLSAELRGPFADVLQNWVRNGGGASGRSALLALIAASENQTYAEK